MITRINNLYPSRIEMDLYPLQGPLTHPVLGEFNPQRDLEVYADGDLLEVQTYIFDSVNNRYLLYMSLPFDLGGVVQVFHHAPNPPFIDALSEVVVPFASLSQFQSTQDSLVPYVSISVMPEIVSSGSPVVLFWQTSGVYQIQISGGGLDTGSIITQGSGILPSLPIQSTPTIFTLSGYDINGNFLVLSTAQVTTL